MSETGSRGVDRAKRMGWGGMTKGFWALLLVMCGMAGGQPTTGGHFRSGSIAWLKLDGNEVEFEIMAEWKRSYSGNYKLGAPANSSIFVGDKINIQGAKSPRLLFGDGAFTYLVSEVTAISEVDDYFRGVTRVRHTYVNPTGDKGAPWEAVFLGCCRLEMLKNDANTAFRMSALLDLTLSSGSIAIRSPGTVTVPAVTVATAPSCKIPGDNVNSAGACFRVQGMSLPCGNHVSNVGLGRPWSFSLSASTGEDPVLETSATANPVLDMAGAGAGLTMGRDGSVRMVCSLGDCLKPGMYNVRAKVMDDKVAFVRILTPGTGCTAGILRAECPACQAPGGLPFSARWTVHNGSVSSIIVDSGGSGFYAPPNSMIQQGICPGFTWELVFLQVQLSFLVKVQPMHSCYLTTNGSPSVCNPAISNVAYFGSPMPFLHLPSFPGIGSGFDSVKQVGVPTALSPYAIDGATLMQDAVGHVQAYAGYDLSLTFTAGVNWCLSTSQALSLPNYGTDSRCVVPEADVTVDFGPLPNGTRFASFQQGSIAELMITYDNPFSSHRPGHEWAVARQQRDYTGMPGSAEAAMLGFTRLSQNLNSGAGGASVYLWHRKYDSQRPGDEAITDIKVSASGDDEARLTRDGYLKLAGNLNEQAGGSEVYIWYKKSSGGHKYDPSRPEANGVAAGISDIAFTNSTNPTQFMSSAADMNPYANGTQTGLASTWYRIDTDLNSGVQGSPSVHLYFRKATSNPFSQRIMWRPCGCDVGRTFVCASARSSLPDGLGLGSSAGNTSCVAVDVLPDIAPVIKSPPPEAVFNFYMMRVMRVPVVAAVHNPRKPVTYMATGLPAGAQLVPEAANASTVSAKDAACTMAPCSHRVMEVIWTPAWNQGGLSSRVCVKAMGEATGCGIAGKGMVSEVCFVVRAYKCIYALQYEQHLQEVASMYHTDWLNIYSLNPSVTAPDRIQYSQQLLNIGHSYVVVPGDTLSKISTRFGTTVDELLLVNADVQPDTIHAGSELCIIPNSCKAVMNA